MTAELAAPDLVRLRCGDQALWLSLVGQPFLARLEQGWYCPQFGEPQRNTVVRWSAIVPSQRAIGWAVWFCDTPGNLQLVLCDAEVRVTWTGDGGDGEHTISLNYEESPMKRLRHHG
ncbi:MAG: hypothetical protein HY000_02490 [Planctomycetes bacterium]|nr:hypothetical protein [Planctomycetota bacterium]